MKQVNLNIQVFWDVVLCQLSSSYRLGRIASDCRVEQYCMANQQVAVEERQLLRQLCDTFSLNTDRQAAGTVVYRMNSTRRRASEWIVLQ